MKFLTQVSLPLSPFSLSHRDGLIMAGSCFSENIGKRLSSLHFPVTINPFGIVFNPIAMANQFLLLQQKYFFSEKDLFLYQELWSSFSHHSRFSHPDPTTCLKNINASLANVQTFLKEDTTFLVTFGTAWIYTYTETGESVANCHKIPNHRFEKRLLSVAEIVEKWTKILSLFQEKYPKSHWIFTLSPVRHWKDGAQENQWSKATLLLSIKTLLDNFPEYTHYFPAYEIVMDELRDYRFFEKDLLHPNEIAVDYLWEKFGKCYFKPETLQLNAEIDSLNKALAHRLLFPETSLSQQFLTQIQRQKDTLIQKYPFIAFKFNNSSDI